MAVAKKLVDTFKSKSWYKVIAPKFLNETELGAVPALDDEHMINRVIMVPLKDITKDMSHMYYSVKLRVFEIKGKTAYTKFIGHAVSREYLRTLVRRRRDVINLVLSAKSKDGLDFRIKVVVVTNNLCSGQLKTAMRDDMVKTLLERAKSQDFGSFIHDVIYGKVANEVAGVLKKKSSIRRVEISKTTLKEDFDTEDVVGIPGGAGPAEEGEKPVKEEGEQAAATHA